MNCPTPQELSAYFDRELATARAAEVESHLADCPSCVNELATYAAFSRSLASTEPVALSPAARNRIRAALHGELSRSVSWVRQLAQLSRPVAAAAVLMIVVGVPLVLRADLGNEPHSTLASSALPEWQATMLNPPTASDAGEQTLADWIVSDLSSKPAGR